MFKTRNKMKYRTVVKRWSVFDCQRFLSDIYYNKIEVLFYEHIP